MIHHYEFVLLAVSALALPFARSGGVPDVDSSHTYPKRSNDDAALLEWGSSAIIHNADGVVARFGPSATHPEFELGVEAELVTASPRQGCEPLMNARSVATQIVVMYRGQCDFGTKALNAAKAGAAAMIVVNSDRRSPDRAFAMTMRAKGEVSLEDERRRSQAADDAALEKDRETYDAIASLPSVMVSYAAGQQLREHSPRRMRLFAGGGRPFIESVTDAAPVLYLVHNAITESEMAAAKRKLAPFLKPTAVDPTVERAHRVLGFLRGAELSQFYERISSIVGYPVDHLGDLALERRTGASHAPPFSVRDERRLSRFNAETGDDSRPQTVMTIYVYLDDGDGGLYFPRARPAPTRVQPKKGLAAIWYTSLENGRLDQTAAHGDGPIPKGQTLWLLHLRVYNTPRPAARRFVLPVLLAPVSGAPSKTLVYATRRFFTRSFGPDNAADAAIDAALLLLAIAILAPFALLAFFAFKAYERAKQPPKRRPPPPAPTPADKKKAAIGKKA
ncbi:hypothetical protein CTAYLR_010463 [Chrysophaeum taylorii]|uniref:PA domain-containing protein n=1 Tax=Chrysophaeum taylorii TaxID=2483200 RepID=A0AAD7U5Y5_9STRA|nr:hypothetical protein CTAYLR_010463 [Chrysophaeum taylorii]